MGLASNLAKLVSKISSGGLLSLSGLENTGADGQVLTRSGGAWSPQALPAGGVTSLNGQTGEITNTDYGAIGSYVIGRPANANTYSIDVTVAGSSLYSTTIRSPIYFSGAFAGDSGASIINVGTWRCVSTARASSTAGSAYAGLWVRIS